MVFKLKKKLTPKTQLFFKYYFVFICKLILTGRAKSKEKVYVSKNKIYIKKIE
jgi:hypothetical protein